MVKIVFSSTHIDRYLRGKMPPEEEKRFFNFLKQHPRLRNVAFTKALIVKHTRSKPRR